MAGAAFVIALLPIKTQEGVDPDWQGMVVAIKEAEIDPSTVGGGHLQPKEIARYYVMTGAFPVIDRRKPVEAGIVRKRVFRNDHPVIFEGERFILFRPD